MDETQKWLKKVERYNVNGEKPIDPKKDVMPAPNAYELAMGWRGKIGRKDKNKVQQNHVLDTISKAPVVNAYYRKV